MRRDLSSRSDSSSSLFTCLVRFSTDSHFTSSSSSDSWSKLGVRDGFMISLAITSSDAQAFFSFHSVSLSACSFSRKALCVLCSCCRGYIAVTVRNIPGPPDYSSCQGWRRMMLHHDQPACHWWSPSLLESPPSSSVLWRSFRPESSVL